MKRKFLVDDLSEFKREIIVKFKRDSTCVKGFLLFSLRNMKFITPKAVSNKFNSVKYILKPGEYLAIKIKCDNGYCDIDFNLWSLDTVGKPKERFVTAIRVKSSNIRNILNDDSTPQLISNIIAFIEKLFDETERLSDMIYLLINVGYRQCYKNVDDLKAKIEPWTIQNIWKLISSETVSD